VTHPTPSPSLTPSVRLVNGRLLWTAPCRPCRSASRQAGANIIVTTASDAPAEDQLAHPERLPALSITSNNLLNQLRFLTWPPRGILPIIGVRAASPLRYRQIPTSSKSNAEKQVRNAAAAGRPTWLAPRGRSPPRPPFPPAAPGRRSSALIKQGPGLLLRVLRWRLRGPCRRMGRVSYAQHPGWDLDELERRLRDRMVFARLDYAA
jgi:hypothetical protein